MAHAARVERIDGFDAGGRLVAVVKYVAPHRLRDLERERTAQLARIARQPAVRTARILPVKGKPITFSELELAMYRPGGPTDDGDD